jgi:hypothetical protein
VSNGFSVGTPLRSDAKKGPRLTDAAPRMSFLSEECRFIPETLGGTFGLCLDGGQSAGRERHKMDERLRFVARLLEGEKTAAPRWELDTSRKTLHRAPADASPSFARR